MVSTRCAPPAGVQSNVVSDLRVTFACVSGLRVTVFRRLLIVPPERTCPLCFSLSRSVVEVRQQAQKLALEK